MDRGTEADAPPSPKETKTENTNANAKTQTQTQKQTKHTNTKRNPPRGPPSTRLREPCRLTRFWVVHPRGKNTKTKKKKAIFNAAQGANPLRRHQILTTGSARKHETAERLPLVPACSRGRRAPHPVSGPPSPAGRSGKRGGQLDAASATR